MIALKKQKSLLARKPFLYKRVKAIRNNNKRKTKVKLLKETIEGSIEGLG